MQNVGDEVEVVFGKVTISKQDEHFSDFVMNCGARQTRMPDGDMIMEQDEYIFVLVGCTFELAGEKTSRRLAFEFAGDG